MGIEFVVPLKLRLILKAKFDDNALMHNMQYFSGISISVHVKLFILVG